jgi:hypothetical protein
MTYEDKYFFESDEFNNIHVYKVGTMEYLDMIEVEYKYDHDEFVFKCKEWIKDNDK